LDIFKYIDRLLNLHDYVIIPGFGGFVAKFNIIATVLEKKYYFLAFMAVLNSVIALYYYMRLTILMALRDVESVEPIRGFNFSNQGVICMLTIPVCNLRTLTKSLTIREYIID